MENQREEKLEKVDRSYKVNRPDTKCKESDGFF